MDGKRIIQCTAMEDQAAIEAAYRALIEALSDPYTVPLRAVEAAIRAYEASVFGEPSGMSY